MKVMGIVGWRGAGKTALAVRLLPALAARGLTVSTVKHAHHGFDIDTPGKDSYAHRAAGATETLVASARRWALMHELAGAPEPGLDALLARMAPVDLALVEGFKRGGHDKIEVRRGGDRPPLDRETPGIVAIASDRPIPGAGRPVLDLDDTEAIAGFIVRHCGLGGRAGAAAAGAP